MAPREILRGKPGSPATGQRSRWARATTSCFASEKARTPSTNYFAPWYPPSLKKPLIIIFVRQVGVFNPVGPGAEALFAQPQRVAPEHSHENGHRRNDQKENNKEHEHGNHRPDEKSEPHPHDVKSQGGPREKQREGADRSGQAPHPKSGGVPPAPVDQSADQPKADQECHPELPKLDRRWFPINFDEHACPLVQFEFAF